MWPSNLQPPMGLHPTAHRRSSSRPGPRLSTPSPPIQRSLFPKTFLQNIPKINARYLVVFSQTSSNLSRTEPSCFPPDMNSPSFPYPESQSRYSSYLPVLFWLEPKVIVLAPDLPGKGFKKPYASSAFLPPQSPGRRNPLSLLSHSPASFHRSSHHLSN